jgi:DNA-binding PadR family transcriptional regulator
MRMSAKLPMQRLVLLYLIERAQAPVSREDLWEFCESGLSYFALQATLSALFDQGLIAASPVLTDERRDQLTENGVRTLEQLYREIPQSHRARLDEAAALMREKARLAATYLSDYRRISPGQYLVDLRIVECGLMLVQLEVNLPTIEQADALCARWALAAPDIYRHILDYADPQRTFDEAP